MKKLVLTILILLVGSTLSAQEEIKFPPAVLGAGGSSGDSSKGAYRWRLDIIHILTLSEDLMLSDNVSGQGYSELDHLISIYPNPVEKFLYLKFNLPEPAEFIIKLSDITGRALLINEARIIQADETLELNLSRFASAIYLLQITSPDFKEQKSFRIQKI